MRKHEPPSGTPSPDPRAMSSGCGRDVTILRRSSGFSDMDTSGEVEAFLSYLDKAERLPQYVELRERGYRELPDGPGVDVGCGHGRAVAELTATGRDALGIDASRAAVEAARHRYPHCRFEVGNAYSLSLPDASQNWYRADRLYIHLTRPRHALAEARRVLVPGGTLVSTELDLGTVAYSTDDVEANRAISTAWADSVANGHIAINIPHLLVDIGFVDVTTTVLATRFTHLAPIDPLMPRQAMGAALAAGTITPERAQTWHAELRRRDRAGTFMALFYTFITTARRPR